MSDLQTRISNNVLEVQQRIVEAARRSGRLADQVTLVAVTKYIDARLTRLLVLAGCRQLAENRPQQLWTKAETLHGDEVHWHMIGHLQRNKVRRTLPLVAWVQSVDSTRLLDTLHAEATKLQRRVHVLLEVNVSGDKEKHGFMPGDAPRLASELDRWPRLDIRGLMAMSARSSDAESARRDFARLRELRDQMQLACPESVQLSELSMGMSRDFETAIEEGATLVRIGSALLQGVR